MKKPILKFSRIFTLLLVFTILSGTLVFAEEKVPDPELKAQLCEDYIQKMKTESPESAYIQEMTAEDADIIEYWGNYGGYEIVLMYIKNLSMTDDMAEVDIAGYTFTFSSGSLPMHFLAYKDSKFVTVKEAYETGLLTEEDICEIAVARGDVNEVPKGNPFTDVSDTDFHYDAVLWALDNKITTGLEETLFGSFDNCTRGQIVTFLWRAAHEPKAEAATCTFKDVAEDAYYYDAVLWAVEAGITEGYNLETFAPEEECTRGQIVTFLHRANAEKTPISKECSFEDINSDDYYYDAVLWAVENNITKGQTSTAFVPEGICTRAEAVTFLYRVFDK